MILEYVGSFTYDVIRILTIYATITGTFEKENKKDSVGTCGKQLCNFSTWRSLLFVHVRTPGFF